ncbi:MAG: Pyridoxal 4-dehydrogenase, partial [Deinococcota bacterium]
MTALKNLWNDQDSANLSQPELLRYRSNLLGSDKRITNYGGGNTSAKVLETDPLSGEQVEVLWVKGSGGDLGSIGLDGFSTLYMSKLEALKTKYRGLEFEDEMVGFLPHCTFNLNPRAASIDTPLHAYVPYKHVDHVHSDAIIAIAASKDGERLTQEIFNGKIGWLPWQRPGYDLGLKLEAAAQNKNLVGLILGGHGLFTWDNDAKRCYEVTLEIINQCSTWLGTHEKPAFGGQKLEPLSLEQRRAVAQILLPQIRGQISNLEPKIGHFSDDAAILEFVCSADLARLAALGTSCPDHFLRTKIAPLVLELNEANEVVNLEAQLENYRQFYSAYYERCKHPNSPKMRDPNAVVYLIAGVGMLTFAKDKATARIAAEYYQNAINVMREAERVSSYVGLPEQEAFDIEYWLLEEAKLQRMPKAKSLAGKIALVTGGAGGIGRATAIRLLIEGACVVLADIDQGSLSAAVQELGQKFSADVVRGVQANMTIESEVENSIGYAAL